MSLPLGTSPGEEVLFSRGESVNVFQACRTVETSGDRATHACMPNLPATVDGGTTTMVFVTGDAEIEEAVASRLYRAELGAAEAHAKLGEW